jgi:hypothetical protein
MDTVVALGLLARRTWTAVGSLRVVLIGFPPVGCTSIRIIATIGYE